MADWRGRGGGRLPGQPSVPGEGGAGAGGGRGGSQPTISSPASWVGAGKGRSGGQPTIAAAVAVSVGARDPEFVVIREDEGLQYHLSRETARRMFEPNWR